MALSSVTQATSKSTAVEINKRVGKIVMNNEALAAAAEATFTLTNSQIGADDVVVVNHASAGTGGAYAVHVHTVAAGSCKVMVGNMSAGSLGEAIVLQYRVLKSGI